MWLALDQQFKKLDTNIWTKGYFAPNQQKEGAWGPDSPATPASYYDQVNSYADGWLHLVGNPVPPVAVTTPAGPTRTYSWAGTIMNTKGKYHIQPPCRVGIRLKASGNPDGSVYNWPCLWLFGEDGEIDIIEGLNGRPMWHFHQHNPTLPDTDKSGHPGDHWPQDRNVDMTQWNEYICEWQVGRVIFFFNNHRVGHIVHKKITDTPMHMLLSYAMGGLGGTLTAGSMAVDWLRVWKGKQPK
jgi:hypothetical protein